MDAAWLGYPPALTIPSVVSALSGLDARGAQRWLELRQRRVRRHPQGRFALAAITAC